MDKLIVNCSTGELIGENFTPEETAQREYEASLPPVIPPKSEVEKLQEELAATKSVVNFILMNF